MADGVRVILASATRLSVSVRLTGRARCGGIVDICASAAECAICALDDWATSGLHSNSLLSSSQALYRAGQTSAHEQEHRAAMKLSTAAPPASLATALSADGGLFFAFPSSGAAMRELDARATSPAAGHHRAVRNIPFALVYFGAHSRPLAAAALYLGGHRRDAALWLGIALGYLVACSCSRAMSTSRSMKRSRCGTRNRRPRNGTNRATMECGHLRDALSHALVLPWPPPCRSAPRLAPEAAAGSAARRGSGFEVQHNLTGHRIGHPSRCPGPPASSGSRRHPTSAGGQPDIIEAVPFADETERAVAGLTSAPRRKP